MPASTEVLCGNGQSFKYSFNYKTGQGAYNLNQAMGVAGQLTDYQQALGDGLVAGGPVAEPDRKDHRFAPLRHAAPSGSRARAPSKSLSETWKEQ